MNGAGKTTAFKTIIGEVEPNEGDVFVSGLSVRAFCVDATRHLGYCSQFDTLLGYLSVQETLKFFIKLRGVRSKDLVKSVEDSVRFFGLELFKYTLVRKLRYDPLSIARFYSLCC